MSWPKEAQYYLPMKDGRTPQLFYRVHPVKRNDGTIHLSLQYLSTCGGGWMGSLQQDQEKFIQERLVPIESSNP